MPLDSLKEAYSKLLGHKCAIERFLVVGEGGLAATLRRIPFVVTVFEEGDTLMLKAALPQGTTKEVLVQADLTYRRQLQQTNLAAKAQAAQNADSPAKASAAPTPAAAVVVTPPSPAPALSAATVNEKRTAPADAPEAGVKRTRTEDADTLARMLVQGIVRILQNRQKANAGPLPIDDLDEEFKALWKVPFNLQQAGETDAVTFLQKWPNKVEVFSETSGRQLVQLAKKASEKGKAPPAATKAAMPSTTVQESSQTAAISAAVVLPDPAPTTSVESSPPATDVTVRQERTTPVTTPQPVPSQAAVALTSNGANGLVAAPAITPEHAAKLRRAQELEKALPELHREATSNLQSMKVAVQKQEALVTSLKQLLSEHTSADRC